MTTSKGLEFYDFIHVSLDVFTDPIILAFHVLWSIPVHLIILLVPLVAAPFADRVIHVVA